MYVVTVDWAEILKALLPLFTLALGSYTTYAIQKQKLKREDETRFHTHRLEVYAEYWDALTTAAAYIKAGKKEGTSKAVSRSLSKLLILASDEVRTESQKCWAKFREVTAYTEKGEEAPESLEKEFAKAMRKFSKVCRAELEAS